MLAIGATGINTRHITIQHCRWRQDTSKKHELWNSIRWCRVHENWKNFDEHLHSGDRQLDSKGYVDTKRDARALDGDFFRAWNIAGFVTIRHNRILDAFNAIHFFNEEPEGKKEKISLGVLIEHNTFVRIRDNAIEPEYYAWNWVVRHNKFIDCYSPFSIQMSQSGYFYIYGNLGWSTSCPGSLSDPHSLGRLFKLPARHEATGPHYIVHNSWFIRSPVFSKKRFSGIVHLNNAIDYNTSTEAYDENKSSPFGRGWRVPVSSDPFQSERKRFTKRWEELDIVINGDIIHHPDFPMNLLWAGYQLGSSSIGFNPGFKNPGISAKGLKLKKTSKGRGGAIGFDVKFMDGRIEEVPEGGDVGAWQSDGLFKLPGLGAEL